jgi:catechol 2,3-dioxygenase-like lactoylglutathione lyase family enzyme
MLDHITLTVSDLPKSRAFYEKVLAPLGYKVRMQWEQYCGFGDEKKPYFWLKHGDPPSRPMHIAFEAKSHAAVDLFYSAAITAGATDNGAPGPRPHYHENYYGAFVFDVDGHPIEAVCHAPESNGHAKRAAPKKKPAKAKPKRRR